MTFKLAVEKREGTGADALRASGSIPAVVYGPKQEAVSLALNKMDFEKLLHEAGESSIVNLEGLGEEMEVLIHDVAFNAEKGGVEHVDFYAIERGKELTTNVALHFEGVAPVTKSGATVVKVLHEIEVTCKPSALPSHIMVDQTVLVDEDSVITIADLDIPADVQIELEDDAVVASVSAAREEEPETVPEASGEVEMPEVIGKEKEESTEEES